MSESPTVHVFWAERSNLGGGAFGSRASGTGAGAVWGDVVVDPWGASFFSVCVVWTGPKYKCQSRKRRKDRAIARKALLSIQEFSIQFFVIRSRRLRYRIVAPGMKGVTAQNAPDPKIQSPCYAMKFDGVVGVG
jgi:hypothetical protein